ncbi:MAG: hypothetical protein NZ750_01605 [Anaerolineae bacterium]|nr:hypothetical protein [Anaerolineae bacterium]MDW8173280.1 hypothetical protein [Anaerolineae bacterium]
MKQILNLAWHRFTIITSIISDTNARVVVVLFYFTIFVPFGLISRLFSDPLRIKNPQNVWLKREPIPIDLDSARQQG